MHFIVLIYYYIVYKKKTDKYYIYTFSIILWDGVLEYPNHFPLHYTIPH